MKKYILKHSKFEAVQLTEDNLEEIASWCNGSVKGTRLERIDRIVEFFCDIRDEELRVEMGDYVVKDALGFFTISSEEHFNNTYIEYKFV